MRIVVCVKPSANGEIGPFEAAAYEAALRISGAEVTLLSMAPASAGDVLLRLTRLGAKEAVLLSDKAFAGADTLATGYTLSLAIKKLSPDLIFCGRQTLEGDTAQVGIGLATRLGIPCLARVMEIRTVDDRTVICKNRDGSELRADFPALLTLERIHELRLPSIRSKVGKLTVMDAAALGADPAKTGQTGSPTRVVRSFENTADRRRCQFVSPAEFASVLQNALAAPRRLELPASVQSGEKLKNCWIVGEKPREMAQTVSDDIRVIPYTSAKELAERIRAGEPSAVLFDSTSAGKELAASVAVLLETGLCADCTSLETDGEHLFMIRPAFGGNVTAKIRCVTEPPMATVRTGEVGAKLIFSCGVGAEKYLKELTALAKAYGAEITASRGAVDHDLFPYECQVGLTGKTVSPEVYVAFGISGAVHHIAGIRGAGTILAVNSDPRAPIFDYADYGIAADVGELLSCFLKNNR